MIILSFVHFAYVLFKLNFNQYTDDFTESFLQQTFQL